MFADVLPTVATAVLSELQTEVSVTS
jgi:hypothetical protein